jgi:hypothetical protein
MSRRMLTVIASVALLLPAAASAHGARLTSVPPGPTHTFTLAAARHVAWHYEHGVEGFPVTMGACGWVRVHVAECSLRMTVVVIDGEPAESLLLIDRVTRSGPCSNAGRVISRHNGITVQDGGHHFGNCFDGPLVDERGPTLSA